MSAATVVPLRAYVATAVTGAIVRARPQLAGADPVVRRSDRADFQSNAALPLAKGIGVAPNRLAAEIIGALTDRGDAVVADVQASGPGFLNITVTGAAIWAQLAARLGDAQLGVGEPAHGQRIVIDYSAPNVAKEMHVGHLRTTIIGDCLARVFGFLGADVVRANHLGDWGTQFGMLIQFIDEHPEKHWHASDVGPESTVSALDGLYKAARARFDADSAFADRARTRVVALQAGDRETVARWGDIVAESEKAFGAIYDRLGVLLTPDDYAGESFYNPMLPAVTTELLDKGVAVHSDGAVVVLSTQVTGPDDSPAMLMVRKGDGGYGYDSTDLATIRYRITALHADRLLYVTDSRQALHFRLIFEAARRVGWLSDAIAVDHVAYGTILGPDGTPFKTRAGGTVRLMDLLDAAVAAARAVVAEKNPELPATELDTIAEQAGIGAVKYADLSTSRVKDYMFDAARMTAFNGNTGVYLQYAHARVCSILRKADEPGAVRIDTTATLEPAERALLFVLDEYAMILADVAETLEPHRLANYLYELARAFTTFYDTCPVLSVVEPVRSNRIAVCQLTVRTLAHGLELLGIAAPARM